MNDSYINYCSDDSFGPTVHLQSCRDGFDFTLLFEESIFAILPSVLLLCAVPVRLRSLYRRPDAVNWPLLRVIKLITVVVLCLLKLALLVLWTLPLYAGQRTQATIASGALDLAAAVAIGLLSPIEHAKSLRPSILLSVFLFFTMLLDIARARTEWLISGSAVIPAVFVASLGVKTVVLLLEALSKARHTHIPSMPELTSGIFSLSFLAWLNPLIYQGNKENLTVQNLYPVDEHISSASVAARVRKHWELSAKAKSYSLAWVIAKALWVPLTLTMIPRLFVVGFSITQPFLIEAAITFVEGENDMPDRYGYGLIGAFAITYLGIAVSTAWYEYLTTRALAMIRAALISVIYESALDSANDSVESRTAISLMGADVERVVMRLQWVISTAPNIIQVGLAVWVLEMRLGGICVAPVLVALASAYAFSQVAKRTIPRQREWMQAAQKRVAMMSDVLGSIKGMKMLGLTEKITGIVQYMRDQELYKSKRFRYVQITNITLGNAANMLSPVITFIGYGIVVKISGNQAPDAATLFSALSLLSMLLNPVSELVSAIPNLAQALECCNRIQQHATSKKRVEVRSLASDSRLSDVHSQDQNTWHADDTCIEVAHADAGWSEDLAVLHDISLKIPESSLTMIIGPVGCGKSTLLNLLLSEVTLLRGSVRLPTDDIAYCDQTPFLTNQSVRQNVLGPFDYDADWYASCMRACALDEDTLGFPNGDESLVGSKGVALSGGQKQRLALARAIYARKKLVVMDDCFSGLDLESEQHCFHHLLGSDGLMRRTGATIVLATHSVKWLPYSDQIVVLGADGRLSQAGSFKSLSSVPGYVHTLNVKDSIENENPKPASERQTERSQRDSPQADKNTKTDVTNEIRGRRDFSNLGYYINVMGKKGFTLFVALVAAEVIFTALQPLWLNWWVQANQKQPNSDLGTWLGVYAVIGILAVVFLLISGGYFLISLVPKSASTLHYSILRSTMSAPMTFIAATDSGTLLNHFTQDMTLVDMQLPNSILISIKQFGNTLAEAILTCVASGYMALSLPFLAVAIYYLQKFYLQTSRQMRLLELEGTSPLFTHFTETLDGIRTIRAFQWTWYATNQNFKLLDLSQRPFYLLLCLQNWLNLVLNVIVACMAVILITLAVTLRHSINSSLLGVAMVSVMGFSQILSSFVNYWARSETALGAIARTRKFVAETPTEKSHGTGIMSSDWPRVASIELRDVSASYQASGPDVLHKINLTIPAGQRFAICGRTGSGKSTLVGLLLRLLDPNSGTVLIGNKDISTYPPEAVRSRLNSLPQDPWFLPGEYGTVRSNLDPLGEATETEMRTALEKTALTEQISSMGGLDAEMRGSNLSAGQRQLFCLARAMVMRRSKLLLLDEATSSVDDQTEQVIMSLIRTEFRGWTIVSVVHRLKSILDFDRVVVMDQGRIGECDTPGNLLADQGSTFARLYRSGGQ